MDISSKALSTRSKGRQRKRWIDNAKQDLHQRGSDVPQQCVKERKRRRQLVHADLLSATYMCEDRRIKEEEED